MSQAKVWKIPLECLFYLAAAACYFSLRTPLLPNWWADFNSDFALVGVMAQHTLEGHFPIFYYGQNYMGGLEWLTAALGAKLAGSPVVSMEILRWNDLLWWFAAGAAWVLFLRRISVLLAIAFAAFFAFGNYQLLWASCLQELTPQYVFFSALLVWALWAMPDLLGRRGFFFGLLLGLAWWTNQTVVFFLLPALWVFQAEPQGWSRAPIVREFLQPRRGLRWFYALCFLVFALGVGIALAGGLFVPIGKGHLKIPNGLSLAKTALALAILGQLLAHLRGPNAARFRQELLRKGRLALPFAAGFLLGFAPVWLGRIFGLYEKSYEVGLAILPVKEWGAQAADFGRSIDTILFSHFLVNGLGQAGAWLTYLALFALVAFAWWQRKRPLVRVALGALLLNGAYVFFSSRAQGAPTRYLYPVLLAAWLIVLVPAACAPRRRVRFPLTLALLVLAAFGSWGASAQLHSYYENQQWRRENIQSVMSQVRAGGFNECWGDYWTSYMLVYLSGESILFTPHVSAPDNQMRVKTYDERVKAANPPCFVSRTSADGLGELRFTTTNPWVKP